LASTSRATNTPSCELALRDDALALLEQVGKDAFVAHRHRLGGVGDDEAHLVPSRLTVPSTTMPPRRNVRALGASCAATCDGE
jgi:hypothetical protein